ncbi:hypothetical protein BJD99_14100 [Rhodococcus sp. 1163]|uniref:LiaF domain-containing protein n=1 Tax=unclassified Rhodococcus (in: high G+C Gram-positive bacteria) TaxID=192944 RepID=UPI000A0387A7|nr:LiaF domain-containing protein [Rhodococcus sp. 1163]ORI17851.1 hypothetical protein BJD99_14100 [Rhodococcus sp. 1163]
MSEASELENARGAAQTRLERAVGEGRLTLAQYSDHAAVVWAPTVKQNELDAIAPNTMEPVPTRAQSQSKILCLLSDVKRAGRWALAKSTVAMLIMGDLTLDLRSAIIGSNESTITIVSLFGDSELIVPDGVNVEIGGFDLLGDRDIDTGSVDPGPYAPTIKIRSFSMFGDLKVRSAR